MNQSIPRLFAVVITLFGLLIVWTSRWSVFDATALKNNSLNRLDFYASLKVKRGRILADNGEVLAKSVRTGGGTWGRTYPTGPLFSQPVGYFVARQEQKAGLEQYRSTQLEGTPTGISSVFGSFGGSRPVGDDVYTTLDPTAQKLAAQLLGGRNGAVVAITPSTGAVKVMYANPSYNDNHPFSGGSQYNRATQGEYPPGSTFKIVTTTAALNSGKYTPNSTIDGKSPLTVSGVPLENDGNTNYGPITLTKALTESVNTVYAQVGEGVGIQTMAAYMKRFGFYSTPPLDYPNSQMLPSGERAGNKLLSPTSNQIDLGRMSIGQDKLTVTPLQMAMVAAAVANHGRLMRPHMTSRVVNQNGQVIQSFPPTLYHQVMKASTASELTQMMTDVVEEGTGQAANLDGLKVAGKTGTAQVGGTGSALDDPWFIGFAPVQDPKVAVAVVLESIPN
ncbi:MAG TPA: penicillin-binding transpeptidase domain-containing protein, partial [Solirubrobacteraceae bacterium]|nr:penicillin-binding transpeptidase domain-containing protein [Solirubrobacteraceae bacterium]